MGLRRQTLAIGLLTLAVPLVGWQSVRQLHASLQETRVDAQTLRVANLRVALAGADELDAVLDAAAGAPAPGDWYAETSRWPLFVDGYADDWRELVGGVSRFAAPAGGKARSEAALALRVARRDDRLFLFVAVRDEEVVHHRPPRLDAEAGENERPDRDALLANGDALEILVETPDGTRTHALLGVIAPGPVKVVQLPGGAGGPRGRTRAGRAPPGWRAEWVDDARGYQVEIELPLPPGGSRVGIAAIDVARVGADREAWVGSTSPRAMRAGAAPDGTLRHESAAAREWLRPWVSAGTRARLFDGGGRLLADVDALYAEAPRAAREREASGAAALADAVLFRVFAWLAAGDLPLFPETEKRRQPLHLDGERLAARSTRAPTRRYVTPDNDRVLGTLATLGPDTAEPRGYVLFESNEEHATAVTSSRLARLFALLLLASVAVGALLLAWTTRLSLRIRRLSREAGRAIDADGRVSPAGEAPPLPGLGARDEIGDLSRDLSALLGRSAAYTRYLERLSSRLSHELGTPLTIVRTSLENLDPASLDDPSRRLVERAQSGAARLGAIVRALVESARLEQSVQRATLEPLDLRPWLREACAQYAQIHPDHAFRLVASVDELRRAPGATSPRALPAARPRVSATLLQQALDKLVDNAVGFASAPDIALLLGEERRGAARWLRLAVANVGPPIGAAGIRAERLGAIGAGEPREEGPFGRARSSRHGEGDAGRTPHGGLGLQLVRLIAEAHGGSAFAADLPATDAEARVVVGIRLPLDR